MPPNVREDLGGELRKRQYALIIGIDNYKAKGSTRYSNLSGCRESGERLKRILLSRYFFSEKNITFLANGMAYRAAIKEKFVRYLDKLNNNDSLIIFFHGHGEYDGNFGVAYWVCSDGNRISGQEIKNFLKKCSAKHIFLIANACYSGEMFMSLSKVMGDTKDDILEQMRNPSRQVLAVRGLINSGNYQGGSPLAEAILEYLENNVRQFLDAQKIITDVIQKVKDNKSSPAPVLMGGSLESNPDGQLVFVYDDTPAERQIRELFETIPPPRKNISGALDILEKILDKFHNVKQSKVIDFYIKEAGDLKEALERDNVEIKKIAERFQKIVKLFNQDTGSIGEQLKECYEFLALEDKAGDELLEYETVDEWFLIIETYREMLLAFARAEKKNDYEALLIKYNPPPGYPFFLKLVKKVRKKRDFFKIKRLYLEFGLNNNNMDICCIPAEYVAALSLRFGYLFTGPAGISPFIGLNHGSMTDTKEFARLNGRSLFAELSNTFGLTIGVDIPLRRRQRESLSFSFAYSRYFFPLKKITIADTPDSHRELEFKKINTMKGLGVLEFGLQFEITMGKRISVDYKLLLGVPFKNHIGYAVQISDSEQWEWDYRIRYPYYVLGLGCKFFLGKKR